MMRKIIKLRDAIFPAYARLPLIFCGVTQFLAYFCTSRLELFPAVSVETPIDANISVISWWVLIYVLAYVYWIIGYIYIARVSREECVRFVRADFISKLVAAAFFIFMPTFIKQQPIEGKGVFDWMLGVIYYIDKPKNLFPSMHCLFSWLICRRMGAMRGLSAYVKAGAYVFTILIFASTLYTGQHLFLDIPGGVILAELAMLISYKLPLFSGRKNEKVYRREA